MQETSKRRKYDGTTARAIQIGLFLVPVNVYWVTIVEMKYRAEATALPIFIYPIFILFCLVVFNNCLSKVWQRICLSPGKLLTIYSMLVISTSIASYGMLQDLFAFFLHPYQFASPENEWKELFFHYIPPWFTANTPYNILAEYYEGDSTLYKVKHLNAWIRPILVWTVFTLVLLFMLHCMNTLVRRQWVQTERLAFPIITFPSERFSMARLRYPRRSRSHERITRPVPNGTIYPPQVDIHRPTFRRETVERDGRHESLLLSIHDRARFFPATRSLIYLLVLRMYCAS